VTKILILAANPRNLDESHLDEEVQKIRAGLDQPARDEFEIISEWVACTAELEQLLFDLKPQIVHFLGHGAGCHGLALENETGQVECAETLARLFGVFGSVECVLLNVCDSGVQATAIHQHVDYVVAMNQAIGDRAAIEFAVRFYDALRARGSYADAFESSCGEVLEGIPQSAMPILKVRTTLEIPVTNAPPSPAEPSSGKKARVFISYSTQEPDFRLAEEFYNALQAHGHHTFLSSREIVWGEDWPQRIDQELERCDYFLLLLSFHSAFSEMVAEEVRRAKELQNQHGKPSILPIRLNFPRHSPLSYDLRSYLQRIQQREWRSSADTARLLNELLTLLATGAVLPPIAFDTIPRFPEDHPDQPPLPVAEPELNQQPNGPLRLDAGLYVNRPPHEEDCYQAILDPGALIQIKAPQQMGKKSLMARILNHAKEQGYQTIHVDFQSADCQLLTDLDSLLRWFCEKVGRQLQQLNQNVLMMEPLEPYWTGEGSKNRCQNYFESCLLKNLEHPLVLALGSLDLLFPYTKVFCDFAGLLRSWYEDARHTNATSELWAKLRWILVFSTESYLPLDESPLQGAGTEVKLPEFSTTQVKDLGDRYHLALDPVLVGKIMQLVGGHPYLIRKAFYELRRSTLTLEQLVQTASTEEGIYTDHLRRHWLSLQRFPEIVQAMRQVVVTRQPVIIDSNALFYLKNMGLVKAQGNGVIPRCDLYRQYFQARLRS
jgi:hypothetical protein